VELLVNTIQERSGGQIEIEIFHGGELLSASEHYEAIRTGVVNLILSAGPYFSGTIPEADIEMSLPMSWTDYTMVIDMWYDKGMEALLSGAYGAHDIKYLAPVIVGPYMLHTVDLVSSVADIAGMKLRGMGFWAEFIKALGASATAITSAEVGTALNRGTIDGIIFSMTGVVSPKHYETLNYTYEPAMLGGQAANMIMNLDEFNNLPDDLKNVVQGSILEILTMKASNTIIRQDDLSWKEAADNGMTKIAFSEEDVKLLRQKAAGVWEVWGAKTAGTAEMLKLLKNYYEVRGLL